MFSIFGRGQHGFYDALARPTDVVQDPNTANAQSIHYGYDNIGNRLWMETRIGGNTETFVSYGYDKLNRVDTVRDHDPAQVPPLPQNLQFWDDLDNDPNAAITGMQYNPLGQMTSISRPNQVTTSYTYGNIETVLETRLDENNQPYDLTENPYQVYGINHSHAVDGLISQYDYEYDWVGNRTGMDVSTPNNPQTNITYEYDRANRMISESYELIGNAASTTEYAYDRAGNRTQMRHGDDITRYSYNANDELTRVDMPDYYFEDYTYDSRGNLTSTSFWRDGITPVQLSDPTLYEYNARNLLSRIELPTTQRIDYEYDYRRNRVRQEQVGSQDPTLYLWDEFSRFGDVILETGVNFSDGSYFHKMDYTLAGGMLISQTDDLDVTRYFLSDAQGTTRIMTDDTGAISSEYNYDAFGNLDENIDPLSAETDYLYAGQQFDGYSELYSMRARYYDPTQGRFMTRDTWAYNYQNPFELNRYAYGANNPATFTDPSGHQSIAGRAIIAGTLIGAVGAITLTTLVKYQPNIQNPYVINFELGLPFSLLVYALLYNAAEVTKTDNLQSNVGLDTGTTGDPNFSPGGNNGLDPNKIVPALLIATAVGKILWCAFVGCNATQPLPVPTSVATTSPATATSAPTSQATATPTSEPCMFNLDSSTLTALSSNDGSVKAQIIQHIGGDKLCVTETAFDEWHEGMTTVAGPTEQSNGVALLPLFEIIPDNPSPRFRLLIPGGNLETNDIVIFGTGDQLGIQTLTGDGRAIRGIRGRGILNFNSWQHDGVRLRGE